MTSFQLAIKEEIVTIVVQNRYFIKGGQEAEGLATRRRASEVRADENRPTGRIMVSTGPQEGSAPSLMIR